jgi:hypothetical protein
MEYTAQDVNFLKLLKEKGVDQQTAFAELKKKKLQTQSPAVSMALKTAESAMGEQRVGELAAQTPKLPVPQAMEKVEQARPAIKEAQAKGEDYRVLTEILGKTPEEADEIIGKKSLVQKAMDIPSLAMEGAEAGEKKKMAIQQKEEQLKAEGKDFATRLSNIEITDDMPIPDKVAAWSAKNTGKLLGKLNEMGVEALPYTEPIKAAIYEQFVDPIFESVMEADIIPERGTGDWFQSMKEVGEDIKSVIPEAVKEVPRDFGEFIQSNPDVALELEKTGASMQAARPIVDMLITRGLIKNGGQYTKAVGELAQTGAESLSTTVGQVRSTLTPAIEAITKPKFATARNDLAESMINSMIKVDPARGAENFYKLSKGQTMGNFLLERDIIGTPEQTVEQLLGRFKAVKNNFDDAILQIEGSYKFPAIKEALDEMEARFIKTKGPELSRIKELQKKFDGEGLNMAENLELKRLYEKKVKTGYLKDNNSVLVERATNIDSQIREDFVRTAKESGFDNVQDLSREIQLTKAAMDSIESKAIRQLVNNQFSLTDNLLLVGGAINPSSLAVLGIKKIAGTPSVQAKIIKALATNDVKTMKAIPGVPKEIINAKNATKRQTMFEQWLEQSGLKSVIDETELKKLPEPSSIQVKGATDILETRGQQLKEGTGVFENQRSVKESTTPSSNIKSSSNIDDSIPDFKKGANPPTTFIQDAKVGKKTLVIDSDAIKKEMPGYTEDLAPQFHKASSAEAKARYAEALKDPYYDDVVIMGGGSGSGKTEVFVSKNLDRPNTILFDGTLADKAAAQTKIDQALKAGKNVKIEAVMAPIEDAFMFASDRGRYIPRDVFADKHYGFRKTLYELAKENPSLEIGITINSKAKTYTGSFKNRPEMLEYLKEQSFSKEKVDSLITKGLAKKSLETTKGQGGITISREGVQPKEGYSFAPSKNTETKVSLSKISEKDIETFLKKYGSTLKKDNNYFGAWVEDGQVWMDISQVLKDKNTALKLAKKANQEAVFDLSNFETIYLEPPS